MAGGSESYDDTAEQADARAIERRCAILDEIIHQIDQQIGIPALPGALLWEDIHPVIVESAYNASSMKAILLTAIEAAFEEVNSTIRVFAEPMAEVALDGEPLIYAGAMTALENLKARADAAIDASRARHFLFVASLLMYRLEETSQNRVAQASAA